ncbi:MAG: methionine--tRNA ligase, partial [Rhodoferax sp.]|nr:methionine--tRNA ligase [Rhodoferax sp.]
AGDVHAQLLAQVRASSELLQKRYEERNTLQAVMEVMRLADLVNGYWNEQQPWGLPKKAAAEPDAAAAHMRTLHRVSSTTLEAFRVLTVYLTPILPALSAQVE